jgi:RNA polymerase sigma factor for flagellar operon FliA
VWCRAMTTTSIIPSIRPSVVIRQQRVDRLVPQVGRMARHLARRLPQTVLLEDLEGAGSLGLAAALCRGNRFSDSPRFDAYAVQHIRGAMLSELRRRDPLTRQQRQRARQIAEATRRAANDREGAVDAFDVARAAGLSEDQYWETLRTVQHSSAVSLDWIQEVHGPLGTSHSPLGGDAMSVDLQVDAARKWRRVCEAAKTLPERQRKVIELCIEQDMKLCEIAKVLGVSESRVSQIRSEAIRRLRAKCDVRFSVRPAPASDSRAMH